MSKPLSFTMKSLDGKDVDLSKYQGKVVLIVNLASKCGLTPQYEQLQALHDKYAENGLAVLEAQVAHTKLLRTQMRHQTRKTGSYTGRPDQVNGY